MREIAINAEASELDLINMRLDGIEREIREFKELAAKIYGFVETMKSNPMLAAMLGGLPK